MEKKTFKPCRENALDYSIKNIDEHNQKVVIRFSSGTRLDLPFNAFNTIIDYLVQNRDRSIRIGSTLNKSTDYDTLESVIQSLDPEKSSHTKRAVHICDILQECGFVDFGQAMNPETRRLNQAVKWK